MKNRLKLKNINNEFEDERQSHSITNMKNNRDNTIRRCCKEPFSWMQWILVGIFFISLQLCVVFANLDTKLIEKFDTGMNMKMMFPPK